jgi:group I intron endonuclease
MLGIYAIIHTPTGRRYVGQSIRIKTRFREHRKALQAGTHYNVKLQRAWAAYGEAEFTFVVLEGCAMELLTEREQFYIDQQAYFNTSLCAESPMRGQHHTDETRTKMRKAWDTRDRHVNKGAVRSAETRAQISATLKGRSLSADTKAKMSATRKGKPLTPGTGAKISAGKLGVSNTKIRKAVRCLETGQVFESLKATAEHFKGDDGHLSKHLKGKTPTFRGHTFDYVTLRQTNPKENRV